jgi:hypothetical protein
VIYKNIRPLKNRKSLVLEKIRLSNKKMSPAEFKNIPPQNSSSSTEEDICPTEKYPPSHYQKDIGYIN